MIKDRVTKNVWKRLFFTLLFVNIAFFIIIISLVFLPVSQSNVTQIDKVKNEMDVEGSEFIVRTTKKNLNELINAYLTKLLRKTEHNYYIILEDDVQLLGELPVFSSTVPLFINFEPIVQENGDIVLKQKSISVGMLQLPNRKIMGYVKKYLPMPEWVTVNPKDEEIYVSVTEMDIKSNFKVGVEQFDLEANNIALKIKVPYETLGIDIEHDLKNEHH